ncbi:MAG: hypothetical protein ACQEUM_17170 [Pseudomonadota bacterium]
MTETTVQLAESFAVAFDALLEGATDFVLQCTAHPSHGECVGRYMHRAFPVDAFIAGSKPLAVLARREIETPRSIGLQPATRHYTDLSGYTEQIEAPTIVDVAEGLLEGRFEAGLCARETLEQNPQHLRLVEDLGPALDTWVLFGREKLPQDPVIWPQAPVVRQFGA